ncbi:MAG: acylphosphatase [Phycisphaerae bacterium]
MSFRFTACNIAKRCELTGFVRNLPDGGVEMLAQGTAETIDDCIRDIVEEFSGYIRETEIKEIPLNPQYTDFKITF